MQSQVVMTSSTQRQALCSTLNIMCDECLKSAESFLPAYNCCSNMHLPFPFVTKTLDSVSGNTEAEVNAVQAVTCCIPAGVTDFACNQDLFAPDGLLCCSDCAEVLRKHGLDSSRKRGR